MIDAIIKNLHRGIKLLNAISDEEYSNTSIAPYYSSIGGHMRHILDVFFCVFDGIETKKIDLSNRERNLLIEQQTKLGIDYFNTVIKKLEQLKDIDFDVIVSVTDDLGIGKIAANYTLGGILIQAHSHAIHHFASVGFIVNQLEIALPDEDFGYNPTTLKRVMIK